MPAPLQQHRSTPCDPWLDFALFGQIHRRAQSADVDLLAHHQLPQLSFGTAVDGLNVVEVDVSDLFHGEGPTVAG